MFDLKMGNLSLGIVWTLTFMANLVNLSDGLECMCTTEQCTKSNKMICSAVNTCYVQIMHDTLEQVTGEYLKDIPSKIVRGCIDESMPLLCENRRPDGYSGPWPILHCCQEDWCNRDILPTDPPWLIEERRNYENKQKTGNDEYSDDWGVQRQDNKKGNHYKLDRDNYDSSHYSDSNDHRNGKRHFNILYIAAPVAGACVVLALVIFTLYLMKMNRRDVKHCVKSQQNHISSIYKQKLPLMVEVRDQHQKYFHCAPVHKGMQFKVTQSCSSHVCQSKSPSHNCIKQKSHEHQSTNEQCDNSAGSETRLLV